MLRSILCLVALVFVSALDASAQPRFFFTTSSLDRSVRNPVLFLAPDETGTLYLFVQLADDVVITSLDASLATPTPELADCGDAAFFNLTIPGGSPPIRWSSVMEGPCFASGSSGFGLRGGLSGDPTFEGESNTLSIGAFPFTANDFPGSVKEIRIGQFTQGTTGGGALSSVFLGADDPPVTSAGGVSAMPDARIYIRGAGGLLGDFNGDASVDAADYTVWRDLAGQTGAGLAADADGNGVVDGDDYDVWRGNFGSQLPLAPARAAAPLQAGSGPTIEVIDQGLTPSGNRSSLLRVVSDDGAGALAVELTLDGPLVDVLGPRGRVTRESTADANDGMPPYEKEEDTWWVDSVFDMANPGNDPWSGEVRVGLAGNFATGEVFLAVGSTTDPGTAAELMQVIVPDGVETAFTARIAQRGEMHETSGTIPAPEAAPGAIALLGVGALARQRRSRTRHRGKLLPR